MEFTTLEKRFLGKNEIGRIATVGPDGIPHVVPVCYVHNSDAIWVATDYETRKYRNLLKNNGIALLVDSGSYSDHGLLIRGRARIIEEGPEFRKIYAIFYKKFDWVRADPWKEREAPFLRIEPMLKVSWGL